MSPERLRSQPSTRIKLCDYPTPEAISPSGDVPGCLRVTRVHPDPCAECDAACCRLYLSLTVCDIARIVAALRIPPESFCLLDSEFESLRSPAVHLAGKPWRLMLRSGAHPCVFLHGIGDHRRCAIYEQRPMTCRLYPFRWYEDGTMVGPRVVWCGSEWSLDGKQRRRLQRVIRQSLVEEEASQQALRGFARQRRFPHTQEGLLRFAVVRGAELLGIEPGVIAEPEAPRGLGPRLW